MRSVSVSLRRHHLLSEPVSSGLQGVGDRFAMVVAFDREDVGHICDS